MQMVNIIKKGRQRLPFLILIGYSNDLFLCRHHNPHDKVSQQAETTE